MRQVISSGPIDDAFPSTRLFRLLNSSYHRPQVMNYLAEKRDMMWSTSVQDMIIIIVLMIIVIIIIIIIAITIIAICMYGC